LRNTANAIDKIATYCCENALARDSIGTACRTLAKPRDGCAPTRKTAGQCAQIGKPLAIDLRSAARESVLLLMTPPGVLGYVALVVLFNLDFQRA